MMEFDRRTFLKGAGALAVGSTFGRGNEEQSIAAESKERLPWPDLVAGVNVLTYGNGKDFSVRAEQIVDHVSKLHANSIAVAIPLYQEGSSANSIRPDNVQTPDHKSLTDFAKKAHDKGLVVMLRPFLDESASLDIANGEWRGNISPSDPSAWWDSYRTTMFDYASMAEKAQIDAMTLMVELNSMQLYYDEVSTLIAGVRERFNGKVGISYNFDDIDLTNASEADFVGVDQFASLNIPDDASQAEVEQAWEYQVSLSDGIEQQAQKPVIYTEVGTVGSYNTPYIWNNNGSVDDANDRQKTYLESLCSGPIKNIGGMFVWNIEFNNPNGFSDTLSHADTSKPSFNILSRPAESAIKKCYSSLTSK